MSGFEDSRQSLRTNAKSSMTHHSLEQYVVPATTSSVWHPARKMGRQASDCWMLFWSMQALSSQIVGSVPVASRRCLAHWLTALCVAPGAPSSSCHEWLRKDVTWREGDGGLGLGLGLGSGLGSGSGLGLGLRVRVALLLLHSAQH